MHGSTDPGALAGSLLLSINQSSVNNGMVSDTRGLTCGGLRHNYHELLKRARFLEQGSLYAIRRGAANAIKGERLGPICYWLLTEKIDKLSTARLMQVMGHKDPKIFGRHYISKTTFADV